MRFDLDFYNAFNVRWNMLVIRKTYIRLLL